ncbi:MAG: lysyl-tRNA synthetase, class, partial [Pseudonocardiales bacterium]|nr:lysyl-tRNA synthetase, class [Pseudonocardiales bacterium]
MGSSGAAVRGPSEPNLPGGPVPTTARSRAYLDRVPRALGWVAALLGASSLVDGLSPHSWRVLWAFSPILPNRASAGATAVIVVSGLLLLRVASGLRRRKRAGWRLAVIACAGIALADLVRDERRPVEAGLALVLFVALICARNRFTAVSDPRSQWFAFRVAGQLLAVAIGYGLVALYLPGHVAAGTSFWSRLREILLSLAGAGGGLTVAPDMYADAFHLTLLGLGLLTVSCALVLLLRPAEPIAVLSEEDESALRDLLRR